MLRVLLTMIFALAALSKCHAVPPPEYLLTRVEGFAITADGKYLACLVDDEFRVYNMASRKKHSSFPDSALQQWHLAYSSDSELVLCTRQGGIKVRKFPEGKPLSSFSRREIFYSVSGCFTANNNAILAGQSKTGTFTGRSGPDVVMLDLKTGKTIRTASVNMEDEFVHPKTTLHSNLKGKIIAVTSSTPGYGRNVPRSVIIWDPLTEKILTTVIGFAPFVSRDLSLVGTSTKTGIAIWATVTGKKLHVIEGLSSEPLAFSSDNKRLIGTDWSRNDTLKDSFCGLRVIDLASEKEVFKRFMVKEGRISAVASSVLNPEIIVVGMSFNRVEFVNIGRLGRDR